jgi:hypothetical protein
MVLKKLYYGARFWLRVIYLRRKVLNFDSLCPFQGSLSNSGYASYLLDEITAAQLRSLYVDGDNTVYLTSGLEFAIEEIFSLTYRDILDYLGPDVKLDGINWSFYPKNAQPNISGNWHTDNVGARLKLFVCIYGDGSQPTLIIPSRHRLKNFRDWILHSWIESFRWMGFLTHNYFKGQIKLPHKTGSIYLFDTDLLHRGGYEVAKDSRLLLQFEFSNRYKRNSIDGPIGTTQFTQFYFDPSYLNLKNFSLLLDVDRVKSAGSRYKYSD